jgi:hypothetical protein
MESVVFDILSPKLNERSRSALYLLIILTSVCIGVTLVIFTLNYARQFAFVKEHSTIAAIAILIMPVLVSVLLFRFSKALIDKSVVIGSLKFGPARLDIKLNDSVTSMEYEQIDYLRFKSAMGWSLISPNAYKIQLIAKSNNKFELDFVQATKNGSNIRYVAEKCGLKTRYWNL